MKCQVSGLGVECLLLFCITNLDYFPYVKRVIMLLIKRFEDIRAWQEARILTRKIYKLSAIGPFGQDFGLRLKPRICPLS
jgi:hypothetical protein